MLTFPQARRQRHCALPTRNLADAITLLCTIVVVAAMSLLPPYR